MSKYQLWSRDEYGQGSILSTSEDIDELIKTARKEVTNLNVNNALTGDDRARNWEAYYIDISVNKGKTKYIYGEKTILSKETVYKITSKDVLTQKLSDVKNVNIKIYLGNISPNRNKEEDWFAKDNRQNLIKDINHQDLNGKTVFFIKKL